MPFTVITLRKVPPALRGDLTKWMQEIATGVYVGNFNTRIRENLWKRVCDAVGDGEATLSYTCRNEIGYEFQTVNTERKVISYDGIPLVLLPAKEVQQNIDKHVNGYSNAYKLRKAKRYVRPHEKTNGNINERAYVAIDIETTGLSENNDQILEIGAVKSDSGKQTFFQSLIQSDCHLSQKIIALTGISMQMLKEEGRELKEVLVEFLDFIGEYDIVGYNINFDLKFINAALRKYSMPTISNRVYDLMRVVKKEKVFQADYKLQTSLSSYGIQKLVPHRALEDAKLIYELSTKVNKIWE